jgi:hypothetical protein
MKNTNNSTPISRGHLPLLSSHSSRQVLQGDDTMNQTIKSQIQLVIEKWVQNYNITLKKDTEDMAERFPNEKPYVHEIETKESLGIMIHFGDDNDNVAIDGELLAEYTMTAECDYLKTLWANIYDILMENEYEYWGMGLFKAEGGE